MLSPIDTEAGQRKLNAAEERHIMLNSVQYWNMSSSAISKELVETNGTQVQASTVWINLARCGLHTSVMETRLNYA